MAEMEKSSFLDDWNEEILFLDDWIGEISILVNWNEDLNLGWLAPFMYTFDLEGWKKEISICLNEIFSINGVSIRNISLT